MTANYHTPLPALWTPTSADWNTRLGDLDATIHSVVDGSLPWVEVDSTPTIPPTGFAHLFVDNGVLNLMDDDGTVSALPMTNPELFGVFIGHTTIGSEGTFTSGAWRTRLLNIDLSNSDQVGSVEKVPFTNGGPYELQVGDTIRGKQSSVSERETTIWEITTTSGDWGSGTAAGEMWVVGATILYVTITLAPYVNNNYIAGPLHTDNQDNVVMTTGSVTNQLRLRAGTYLVQAICPATGNLTQNQTRLYDVTNDEVLALGTNAYVNDPLVLGRLCRSFVVAYFTLTDTALIEVQHRTTANGEFGSYENTDYANVHFSLVEVWKQT